MKDNGGPAFPAEIAHIEVGIRELYHEPGMTLRDYFAGQALIAMPDTISWDETVEKAYKVADAMLKERNK